MASQPIGNINLTDRTLQQAYERLEIKNTSISDGDVVAAFHHVFSDQDTSNCSNAIWPVEALEVISERRKSGLLAFVLTIVPHLTPDNVRLLGNPPNSASECLSPTETKERQQVGAALDIMESPKEEGLDSDTVLSPAADATMTIEDGSGSSSIGLHANSTVQSPDDSSYIYDRESSTEGDSTMDDFEEDVGGKFWTGQEWRCEQCWGVLEEGDCCHHGPASQCSECNSSAIDGDDDDDSISTNGWHMTWDDTDRIWRCSQCHWEIEANNEDEGQCHCLVDPTERFIALPIRLSQYEDYGPGDSDSSCSDSSDSEPDSEDEAFIEDDGPFRPDLLSWMAHDPLAPILGPEGNNSPAIVKPEDDATATEEEHMDMT
ncbi:MAG: hypothetical protein Q9174_004204 [Haloplaca sp. 1 TL-2023]